MDAEKILKLLVLDEKNVKYHKGWGYYIKTPFEEIRMIGLIKNGNNLELSLFYGDTQNQSRTFYELKPRLENFISYKWIVRSNFHLQNSFGENLIWFDSNLENQEYLNFWVDNRSLLRKHLKSEISDFLKRLEEEKVIIIDSKKRVELDRILNKDYSAFNICAGFALTYKFTKEEINELENHNILEVILIDKINDGLNLIGKNSIDFLKFYSNEEEEEESGDPDGL